MTPEQALAALHGIQEQLMPEFTTTQRVIAAVPNDKGDWRPHEKSMSALELARHIATSEVWFLEGVIAGAFSPGDDAAAAALDTPAKVLAYHAEKAPPLIEALGKLSGEHLAKVVPFYTFNYPNVVYLNFLLSHSIHHRGQLSVYLRPMGSKVPSIYGGSADEPFEAAATTA